MEGERRIVSGVNHIFQEQLMPQSRQLDRQRAYR